MSFALSLRTPGQAKAGTAPAPAPASYAKPAIAPSKHFDALDGIRGVAIIMVVASHYGSFLAPTGVEGAIRDLTFFGYTGVTLFFALSGFLITRILVLTRDNPDYFSTFYARRSLRIFPLYFGYLFFVFFVLYTVASVVLHHPYRLDSQALWYLTYMSNWRAGINQPGLMHMWSLAVEEQFYMVWPFVIYFAPRRWLIPICIGGFFAALASRIAMDLADWHITLIYGTTVTRMDALLAGAAVGIIQLDEAARGRLVRTIWPVTIACVLGLVPMALTPGGFAVRRFSVNTIGWSIMAIMYGALVFWAATSGANNRFLRAQWLRSIGKYSYGIYVLHLVGHDVLSRVIGDGTLAARLGLIVGNLAVTAVAVPISWRFLEQPFLRRKRQVEYGS